MVELRNEFEKNPLRGATLSIPIDTLFQIEYTFGKMEV